MEHVDETLRMLVRDKPGNQRIYRGLSAIEPETQGNLNGSYTDYTGTLKINPELAEEDYIPTIAHEFQHAQDHREVPFIFRDYPSLFGSEISGAPPEYYRHRAEIRANARGLFENRIAEDLDSGQMSFESDSGKYGFLGQLAYLKALADGDLNAEYAAIAPSPHQTALEAIQAALRSFEEPVLFQPRLPRL
jgi:hypothetical protein